MIDISLLVTFTIIFLVSLVGAYLRTRRRDECLKSFHDFHVTVEQTDGRTMWGVMDLASTGMELHYREDVQVRKHLVCSYVLYNRDYKSFLAIYRFADQLTPENRERRLRDIQRSFHPSLLRALVRDLRNFVTTATDSLTEMVGLLVGQVRKPVGRYLNETGETYLNKLGVNLLGSAGTAYDPLLERFVGERVVIDLIHGDDAIHEHVGIFKNYTADFIEVLDVLYPTLQRLPIGQSLTLGSETVESHLQAGTLQIRNGCSQPLLFQAIRSGEAEQPINALVESGSSLTLEVEPALLGGVLELQVVREVDLVLPRTRAVVRHRAEQWEDDSLLDIVFDLGYVFTPGLRMRRREDRLRSELSANPRSALAASLLGGLLVQRQCYQEAEEWLMLALSLQNSLPDNGRRARMELRELRRRQIRSD